MTSPLSARAGQAATCCLVAIVLCTIASPVDPVSAQAPGSPSSRSYAAYIQNSQKPEPPQTALEATVQKEGRTALPLVWQALATGTENDRRAAAALLAWYRDVRSIPPILAELDKSPDAVIRQQLLFDLNMTLLTEGSPANAEQTTRLAAAHLRRPYEELASQTANDDIDGNTVLSADTIAIFPDPGIPESVPLSGETRKVPSPRGLKLPTHVAATAVRSESAQAFVQAVRKDRYGVAFHITRIADGVVRVATTLYYPNRGATTAAWITLYRQSGNQWLPISIGPNTDPNRTPNGPALAPTIRRDYGNDDPLKIVGLDLAMERVRVDVNARSWLGFEDGDFTSRGSRVLDWTYVPLFDRYTQSDVASVRYTAEFEKAHLGQPNIQFWMDALPQAEGAFRTMAQFVIGPYATSQIEKEGRLLQGRDRDELVAAALKPEPVAPSLLLREAIRRENVQQVQASTRFALVNISFGTGPDGGRGYSVLFERRGNRWVYLFPVRGWIA